MKPWVEVRRNRPERPWRYADLDVRQKRIAEEVREGARGRLLLSELAPVITFGRRTPPADLLLPREALAAQGVELQPTDRGGLATYHGPGQWVMFPVEKISTLTGDPRGVREAVCGLLEIGLAVARHYVGKAEIRQGPMLGVWAPQGKVAAVGIQVQRGILLHGLSINGFRSPTSFLGLRPCGLEAPVGFLLGDTGDFEGMGERILTETLRRFWC